MAHRLRAALALAVCMAWACGSEGSGPTDAGTDARQSERDAGARDRYMIVPLDTAGARSVAASAISADGSLVGGTAEIAVGGVVQSVGAIWRLGGGRTDVPPLAGLSAGVLAFDSDGTPVGYTTSTPGVDYPTVPGAIVAGAWTAIPALPDPLSFGTAFAASGGVIIGYATDADENLSSPWRSGGGTTRDLGSFGGGAGHATGINASGLVVGWSQVTPTGPDDFVCYGFVVPSDRSLDEATRIMGLGGDTTFARGINASGMVVGDGADASGTTHAFVWSASGGIRMIHSPPPGESYVLGRAINARGDVVGTGPQPAGGFLAWRWTDSAGVRVLDELVDGLPADTHVTDAVAIADEGSIVAALTDAADTTTYAVLRPIP